MSEVVPYKPVTVWRVQDAALKVYNGGKLVASIPAREFPNLGVELCKELTREMIARDG